MALWMWYLRLLDIYLKLNARESPFPVRCRVIEGRGNLSAWMLNQARGDSPLPCNRLICILSVVGPKNTYLSVFLFKVVLDITL